MPTKDDAPERLGFCAACNAVGFRHCSDPEHCGSAFEYVRADMLTALQAEVERLTGGRISDPVEPGGFVGDIWFGHPVKTTMGTHRWNGSSWDELPSEVETMMGLLAADRTRRETAERRAEAAEAAGREKGIREAADVLVVRSTSATSQDWDNIDVSSAREMILALLPTPPVADAARDVLMVERIDEVAEVCKTFKLSEPLFRAALAALTQPQEARK